VSAASADPERTDGEGGQSGDDGGEQHGHVEAEAGDSRRSSSSLASQGSAGGGSSLMDGRRPASSSEVKQRW
jgi:hypothetical protein